MVQDRIGPEHPWLAQYPKGVAHAIDTSATLVPANVENAVYTHPAVAEAIMIGVRDAYRGEALKAFVVLKPGSELSLDALQAHRPGKLSPMEIPRLLEIRSELPKTRRRQTVAPCCSSARASGGG
jgi:acyl-coenzyme A synthetase/AMP-(fatty) acid ligase